MADFPQIRVGLQTKCYLCNKPAITYLHRSEVDKIALCDRCIVENGYEGMLVRDIVGKASEAPKDDREHRYRFVTSEVPVPKKPVAIPNMYDKSEADEPEEDYLDNPEPDDDYDWDEESTATTWPDV